MKKIIFIAIFFPGARLCFGHGVEYSIIKGGVGVRVTYSDGKPMSYSEVKIFSPQDKNTEFQTGLTDKNGCFIFYPEVKGKWKIEVNDGMGHGIVKEIDVSDDSISRIETSYHLPLWRKILVGLSIIFGFTGILFYIVAKKEFKKV